MLDIFAAERAAELALDVSACWAVIRDFAKKLVLVIFVAELVRDTLAAELVVEVFAAEIALEIIGAELVLATFEAGSAAELMLDIFARGVHGQCLRRGARHGAGARYLSVQSLGTGSSPRS